MEIIFDNKGKPSLRIIKNEYLASCKAKIYAGLLDKGKVYDFNGTQRGWFSSGILRDLDGKCVGFTKDANGENHPDLPDPKTSNSFVELPKPPLKPVFLEGMFPEKPDFKNEWANQNPTNLMMIPK